MRLAFIHQLQSQSWKMNAEVEQTHKSQLVSYFLIFCNWAECLVSKNLGTSKKIEIGL